jgi:uncharacterized membrane protein
MTGTNEFDDVARYAAAVRSALADLPASEREDLLEDLEDHLAEVATESDIPLTQRLGSPDEYAAELRAAYGARTGERPRRRPFHAALAALRTSIVYQDLAAFLPQLRPAWWVLRGYLAVLVLTAAFLRFRDGFISLRLFPSPLTSRGLLQIVATIVAIWVSVAIGRRGFASRRGWRSAALVANALILLAALPVLLNMSGAVGSPYFPPNPYTQYPPPDYAAVTNPLADVTNIYAYTKDGRPIQNVLLYDQNGQPVQVLGGGKGTIGKGQPVTPQYPIGADGQPIMNAYPLAETDGNGNTVPAPRVAIPPFASPSPTPSPSPSPTATP